VKTGNACRSSVPKLGTLTHRAGEAQAKLGSGGWGTFGMYAAVEGLMSTRVAARLFAPGALLWLFALVGAACGGKSRSADEHGAGAGDPGGAPAVGGSAAGGSNSSSAGAPSSSCPNDQPAVGSSCNYVGPQCNYAIDHCSGVALECRAGQWAEAPHSDGAGYTCTSFGPGAIPADGASCDCFGALDCSIDDCTDQGKVHAVCDNSTWHVTREPCADRPCGSGDLRCKVNELCVAPKGLGGVFACETNPCAELFETTSCTCAGRLCGAARCVLTGDDLDCICDTC